MTALSRERTQELAAYIVSRQTADINGECGLPAAKVLLPATCKPPPFLLYLHNSLDTRVTSPYTYTEAPDIFRRS